MKTLMLLILVAGCHVREPVNEEIDAPEGADLAMEIAVAEWRLRVPHGDRLSADNLPPVRWFKGMPCKPGGKPLCLDYGEGYTNAAGKYLWTPFDEEIHIVITRTIHQSGLIHEILHWSLAKVKEDPDGDHEGSLWEMVPEINEYVRDSGY